MSIPASFRAAVLQEPGKPLEIREVTLRSLGPGNVLVRVDASGLCHTDLEIMRGTLAYPTPVILGHELAGTVAAIGAGVESLRAGQRVVGSWNPACGRCFYCDRDLPILCERCAVANGAGRLLDGLSAIDLDGRALAHFNFISSHAEYTVVPERAAVPVADDIEPAQLCLIGCGVMTGYGAVMNVARVQRGSTVVVVGCGAVGLHVVQAARLAGARRIIAVDPSAARRDLAAQLGATAVVDPTSNPAPALALEAIRESTDERGGDAVFECAGNPSAIRLALEVTRPGGDLVVLGKIQFDHELGIRFGSLMGEKRVIRSSYGGARPHRDFPRIVDAVRRGDMLLEPIITQRLALDDINLGFDAMGRGDVVRAVVVPAP